MKRLPAVVMILGLAASGCLQSTDIDSTGLPSIEDYKSWPNFPVTGSIAGHGDGRRVIYFNQIARSYLHGGPYPLGTVVVKEVFNGDKLVETVVMRKLGDETAYPTQDGWLFTERHAGKTVEEQKDSCWATCHKQAAVDHAFFDYGDH